MWDEPAQDAQPVEEPKPEDKAPEGVTLTREAHSALMERLSRLETSERYWAEQAKAGNQKAAPGDEDDEDDDGDVPDDTPEKLADELSMQGIAALHKRGFLNKKQVRELVAKEATKIAAEMIGISQKNMAQDAKLLGQFPELGDESSELYIATSKNLKEMDPKLARTPDALKIAARLAKAELALASGGREEDRLAKVRRQQGDVGRRGADGDSDKTLSPMQKQMLAAFNRDGGTQITEDAYRARASAGVKMAARPRTNGAVKEVGDW